MTRSLCSLLATLVLCACGGSPKEPAAPAKESNTEATPDAPSSSVKDEAAAPAAQPEPEARCEKDADCTIFADCCSCKAVGANLPPPVPCDSICGESLCEVKGKTISNVACVASVCKLR